MVIFSVSPAFGRSSCTFMIGPFYHLLAIYIPSIQMVPRVAPKSRVEAPARLAKGEKLFDAQIFPDRLESLLLAGRRCGIPHYSSVRTALLHASICFRNSRVSMGADAQRRITNTTRRTARITRTAAATTGRRIVAPTGLRMIQPPARCACGNYEISWPPYSRHRARQ